jgi:taurine dioxygenase
VHIERLSPALGARVTDIDLREPLDRDTRGRLRTAMYEHYLLLFPGQPIDGDQQVDVVSTFGPIAQERTGSVMQVSNRPDGILGDAPASYHIDYGFFPTPYFALSLFGLEIPPEGTQTWFVSGVAAARSLPTALRRRLDGVVARHVIDVGHRQNVVRVRAGRLDHRYPHALRPALWPHRDTGETILAVWEQQTDALFPLPARQSSALIEELFAHLYQPAHRYIHEWQPDDLVVWDNHALQHARGAITTTAARTLRRVCVGPTQDLSIFAGYSVK